MEPFLSVIIPVYNKAQWLPDCLESLRAQPRQDFRVILVDDGSTDGSGALCDACAGEDERFLAVHQPNRGVSAARNCGLALTDTPWVTFVDADDCVTPDYAEALFAAVQEYPQADIFLFDYIHDQPKGSSIGSLPFAPGLLPPEAVEALRLSMFNVLLRENRRVPYENNCVWNKVYRTARIRPGHRFLETTQKGEDSLFNARVFQRMDRLCYIPRALYHYRTVPASLTNGFSPREWEFSEITAAALQRVIGEYHLPPEYTAALRVRVIKKLYFSMKQYYCHPACALPGRTRRRELRAIISGPLCRDALANVDRKVLPPSQRLFVLLARLRAIPVLFLLIRLYSRRQPQYSLSAAAEGTSPNNSRPITE